MSWITDCAVWDRALTPGELPNVGVLYGALLTRGPVGMWALRELSGTVAADTSPNGNDGAYTNTPTLATVPGADGYNYPEFVASGEGVQVPDHADYSIVTNSGLTIVMMTHWATVAGTSSSTIAAKSDYSITTNREWQIQAATGGSPSIIADVYGGGLARRSFSFAPGYADGWNMLIIRFPSTTGFPTIRINGVDITESTTGSGTGAGDLGDTLLLGMGPSGTGDVDGGFALSAIYAGVVSDGDCGVLEAAALAEGWGVNW